MKYRKLAEQMLELLGGKSNIERNLICVTRLRIKLKNPENIDIEKLKKLDRVLSVQKLKKNEVNITLGYGFVHLIGEEFSNLTNIELDEYDEIEEDSEEITVKKTVKTEIDNTKTFNNEKQKMEDLKIEKTVQDMVEKKIKKNLELKKKLLNNSTENLENETKKDEVKIEIEEVKETEKKIKNKRKRVKKPKIEDISELYLSKIKEDTEKKSKYSFSKLILKIFIPILPAIILGGIIRETIEIINILTNNNYTSIWWYQVITTIGWGVFTYLPIFVLTNTVKELKGTRILGAVVGILFVNNFQMPLLTEGNAVLFPITNKSYFYSFGGIVSILFLGVLIVIVEKILKKITPLFLTTFLTPILTVILSSVLGLFIIQLSAGYVIPEVEKWIEYIYNSKGALRSLISFFEFPIKLFGMENIYSEINKSLDTIQGETNGINHLLPLLMMSSVSQVGASLAVFFRTKNKNLKRIIRDCIPAGILGVGEPLLYTVSLPLIRPFIITCFGAGIGGVIVSFFNIGAVTKGVSGVFGFLIIEQSTQLLFILSLFTAFISSFLLALLIGVNEEKIEKLYGK